MSKFKSITKPLTWIMGLILVAFVAGCGGNSSSVPASSAKAITAFSIAGSTGVINATSKTIAVNVPYGTVSTALVATFTTTGASVQVGNPAVTQVSAKTVNDFSSPVVYLVTAADSTATSYTVTVTVASIPAKSITSFTLSNVAKTINSAGTQITGSSSPYAIAVTMPRGTTDLTALVATYSTTGTSVKIGSTLQVSGTTQNSYSSTVTYTVTANDSSTADYVVTVTVASSLLPVNPTAPALGETARFVIIASQAVTTTTGSVVTNGDIGIMDLARSNYAGFTAGTNPGQFTELTNGLSYAHDDTSPALIPAPYASTIAFINQVRTDLGIADSFLAADPNPGAPTQVSPTELGNLTLTRGVYKTASNVTIQTGALHLDAQGDPNSVWIFNIGGTLTTGAPGGSIILDNGAQAKNVYWRTAGITTIGAGTAFVGNAFAFTQVNVLTGAAVTGRLFGETGQVTLQSNAVTKAP